MFKPFFVHINPHAPGKRTNKHPRGATMYVSPSEDERICQVQVALCSPKDEFNKKIGRETAMKAGIKIVNRRMVPKLAKRLAGECKAPWGYYEYDHLLANFL